MDELEHIQHKVSLSCRILAMTGLVKETTGHVSARIPGTNDMFIRGRGDEETGLLFTAPGEIVRAGFDGKGSFEGLRVGLPQEWPIHGEIFKARPEVNCVVHAHPRACLLCGLAAIELRPIFGAYDPSAMKIGQQGVPVYPRAITINRPDLARPMIEMMGQKNLLLMRGHGITVTGGTVEEATIRAIKLETLAGITWELSQRGPLTEISQEDLDHFSAPTNQTGRKSTEPVWEYYVELLDYQNPMLNHG